MNTRITKRNGRMTKREVVRCMAERAESGESSPIMAVSYVARRIDQTVPETYNFLRSLNRKGMINIAFSKRSVIFAEND